MVALTCSKNHNFQKSVPLLIKNPIFPKSVCIQIKHDNSQIIRNPLNFKSIFLIYFLNVYVFEDSKLLIWGYHLKMFAKLFAHIYMSLSFLMYSNNKTFYSNISKSNPKLPWLVAFFYFIHPHDRIFLFIISNNSNKSICA